MSAMSYAKRLLPDEVQSCLPFGDTAAHIAFLIVDGSSFTSYSQASVAGSATPIAPVFAQLLPL